MATKKLAKASLSKKLRRLRPENIGIFVDDGIFEFLQKLRLNPLETVNKESV